MESGQLQRRLGLTSAVTITVGAVIGSGIFLKPLSVAQALPSESAIYMMWVGLGLVCLFGAFAYAELGAMFPEAGGQYAFLREGWGRCVSFLYGWTFFWVINAGTIAALA
ncbi:MAG: APA family basic amino acid/polyamine antiporter, partial [Planctomycetota bacterium]